jgi:cytochrome c oxidase accessory protein FixG
LPKFQAEELGDCIDCTMCVQVCPTGIDIRNGLQYECIACGLCIDACDEVMDKMGFAGGLIRYSTQNAIDGKPSRILRPRVLVYGALLLVLVAAWIWGISARSPLIAEVLRDRNALYRVGEDGIDNGYTLKLVNKTDAAQEYRITLQAATAGIVLGKATPATVKADAEQVVSLPLEVNAPETLKGRHEIHFVIESTDGKTRKTIDSSFFGPM